MKKIKKSKNKINLNWDFSHLCENDSDALNNLKEASQKVNEFAEKWSQNDKYLEDIQTLKKSLDDYENLYRYYGTSGHAGYYISLKNALYQDDPKVKALNTKINDQARKNINKILFFELKLSKINIENQEKILKSNELSQYKHFLENIFKYSKHLLSESEEKIINLLTDNAKIRWEQMIEELLSKEEKIIQTPSGKQKLPFESILSQTKDTKHEYRKYAGLTINKILKKYIEIGEHELNAILEYKKISDNLRNYSRPDESRHLSDDINSTTVDTLVRSVSNHYYISRRFYKLKAKLLGQNKIGYYERAAQVKLTKFKEKKYEYDKAYQLVLKVLSNLDNEFGEILESFNENGLIDVLPKKGKRGGAFCAHELISQPTYILLNHNNKLNDVLTIAHEVGHGINNELIKKNQNSLNFGTPTSTAEVASTFMEDFVLEELLKEADELERLELIISKLDEDIATIFRQIALYQFEQELHNEYRKIGYLSYKQIGKLFKNHMENYLGEFVDFDKDAQNWWLYWSHIRMYFYVYSYASGLLISKSLQNRVRKNKQEVLKVKEFLSQGLVDKPENIFLNLGININQEGFWEEGLQEIEDLLLEAEKLATKLGKI